VAPSAPRFVIGIDLGTTNCALASIDTAQGEDAPLVTFEVPQLVAAGQVEPRSMLPSFLYLPGEHELPAGALALPWDDAPGVACGEFARAQGVRIPGRLVSSAKSWLCHAGIDRKGPVLPWHADADVTKTSPVDASARYLAHLAGAWDHAHPDAPIAAQEVLLAVPASFDAVARELTVEAARRAGLGEPRLIEEPQAAFYSWVHSAGERWREQIAVGDLVLVLDVGGGTTDLSLISVGEADGALDLARLAVGDHLLVGGDNMDLALARALEAELAARELRLDGWQLQALMHGCRAAKEALLGAKKPKAALPISIPGRGSKLIGGAIKTELPLELVSKILVDGFFPACDAAARPARRRIGLAEIGLPYENDPAITRHVAAFLARHAAAAPEARREAGLARPDAVLFNGGVFKAGALRTRALEVLGGFSAKKKGELRAPRELSGAELDLAVARGAACYGLALRGKGVRIRGGTARAYYIGVEAAMPAVPGLPTPVRAVCVAPFGMEEGTRAAIPGQRFGLLTGEPASFRFFGSSARRGDVAGTVLDRPDELDEIDPVEVTLAGEPGQVVPVTLESALTELGTLELWSVEDGGSGGRWKLEYELRARERALRDA